MKARYIALAILSSLLTGCGHRDDSPKPGSSSAQKAGDEIDFGTLTNGVYRNNYLGFTIAIPTNWSVQSQESQQQLMKTGGKVLAGDDKNFKAALKAAELQTVNLFAVFKYPLGSPLPVNPAVITVAERVTQLPGIQRGKDYLFHVREALESGQLQVSFPGEIYTARLGDADFDVMEIEMSVRGKTVKEKYYAAIRKRYALSFILLYASDEDETETKAVLDTLKFN